MRHNNSETFTYPEGVTMVAGSTETDYLESLDIDSTNVTAYIEDAGGITFWRTWTHPDTARVYVTEYWRTNVA